MSQFPYCPEHHESEQEFLFISESGFTLYCSQCIFKFQNEQNQVDCHDIIHLKMVKNNPEELLFRIFSKQYHKILDKFTQMEQLQNLFKQCLSQITELKKNIDSLYEFVCVKLKEAQVVQQKMRNELSEILQFDQLIASLSEFQKTTVSNSTDNIQSLGNSFFECIKEFQKNKQDILVKVQVKQFTYQGEFQNLKQAFLRSFYQFKNFIKQQHCKIETKMSYIEHSSSILDQNYFLSLVRIVELKQNSKVLLIKKIFNENQSLKKFSLDDLWNAIVGKYGFVFGVFAPCKWTEMGKYFTDNSLTSFIFSQTFQEIYPIKFDRNESAQFFGQKLTFGGTRNGDEDISITPNFQNGSSQLGVAFGAQEKDSTKESGYLFGGLKPNIIECEVYELL